MKTNENQRKPMKTDENELKTRNFSNSLTWLESIKIHWNLRDQMISRKPSKTRQTWSKPFQFNCSIAILEKGGLKINQPPTYSE